MGFSSNENWAFPTGTVWIKHFELELTNGVSQSARRLETRFLVRNSGGVYGITYRWDDAQANAFLVPTEGMDEAFLIHDGAMIRTQVWHYPARAECSSCHTPAAGFALGFNTGQLNRDHGYGGTFTNQILALSQMGYFSNSVTAIDGLLSYAPATDETVPVEHRVRSYLAANCVQCHQPDGSGRGYWDARFTTPLPNAGIINGALIESQSNPDAKVIKPGSLEDSLLFKRVSELGSLHMPPLATTELNQEAIDLLARWITNELVALDLRLPAGSLAYTEGAGPVVLDPGATIATAGATSLAGGSLRVEFDQDALTEDRLAVRNVGDAVGEIGVLDNVVRYGGIAIGIVTGGMSGSEPLVVAFNANVTTDAAQALLRNVTYENVSTTPAILTRTLRVKIANATASARAEFTITVALVVGAPALPDFTLGASPVSQAVTAGGSTSYSVATNPTGGFAGQVTLSVSGLPSGGSGSFTPNPATASSTLSVTTSTSTPAGSYTLTITGVSGSLTHTTTVSLTVAALGTGWVTYDNKVSSGFQWGVTSVTTPAFIIGSGANRAAMIMVAMSANNATGITASLGGVSGTVIPGTDSGTTANIRTLIFQVINPPSGAQTATVSWTTSMNEIGRAHV